MTGPTCSGKTSLEAELQRQGFGRAISHTTRQRRSNEVNGIAYHFVNDVRYATLDRTGEFIETVDFGSSRYAMSRDALWRAMKDSERVVIVAEPYGAQQIHDFCREEGIASFAFWVDCEVKTQARRWIARMMADMAAGKDVAGPYSERLTAMLSEESVWRSRHLRGDLVTPGSPFEYSLSLDSEQNSAAELAQQIQEYLSVL